MSLIRLTFSLVFTLLIISESQAQYFGQNKPRYQKFDFEVLETPNFDLYHYLENEDALQDFAQWSEDWYRLHQAVLRDTIEGKNPLILYNNHAHFQQTNAISGAVGPSTGGVTEAFKNRVIMPYAPSQQQTHHVLGHELVHAFQYNMILRGDSTSLRNLRFLPLWMTEGMAEYLSIGREDPHTAMWMRDAVLNDNVPSIKDLSNPRYFPYRYGQAFWAFMTGTFGDGIIRKLYRSTAKYGLQQAVQLELGMSVENLSTLWQDALKNYYKPLLDKSRKPNGKLVLSEKNSGRINVSPVLSPNGKYVIYLSEKNLFSIDLFLAEARSGKVIRQVASKTKDGHIDAFNSIESAGSWSPNSKQFVFVAFAKGQNRLIIKNVENGKTDREIEVPGVQAIFNPIWSPSGKEIVMTGLVQGQIDLYSYNLKTKKVKQLTDDAYSEIQPQWSFDGSKIVFATDRLAKTEGRRNGKWWFNLAELDLVSGQVSNIEIFKRSDNLNPVYDLNGDILFLSNRDGFRNLYRYEVATGKIYQRTDLNTGISGITHYAPAITTSRKRNRVLYTYYNKGRYSIYKADVDDFQEKEVSPEAVGMAAAILPPINPDVEEVVNANFRKMDRLDALDPSDTREKDYKPQFKLDYVGGGGGFGVGRSNFGAGAALNGGVDLLFSDILGNNQFYSSVFLNGEIQDIGGQVAYINRKNPIAWGVSIAHLPFRTGGLVGAERTTLQTDDGQSVLTDKLTYDLQRITESQINVFAQYPLSIAQRFEVGTAVSRYGFQIDRLENYFLPGGGPLVFQERNRIASPDAVFLYNVNAAWVGDNSFMGLTAPLQGYRFRVGIERNFGAFDFYSSTIDYRKYVYKKPVSFAFRGLHFARFGGEQDLLPPIFIGNPALIRGYDFNAVDRFPEYGLDINQLVGNQMLISNFEIRLPFTGPAGLALIKSGFLLSDLNFFVDGGIAYDSFSDFQSDGEGTTLEPRAVFSGGVSLRVNLFGAMILEPYYAIPFQQNTRGVFGLNIVPGW